MDQVDRRCLVYADLESVRSELEASGATLPGFVERLLVLARTHGRVFSALAYGDVTPEETRELRRLGCEARLTTEDGEGSAPESIAVALDAAEALAAGPEVESVLLVTDDAQLSELVRRLRRRGRFVTVVAPSLLVAADPCRTADRATSVEALLAGAGLDAPPPTPPVARELLVSQGIRTRPAAAPPFDPELFDWTRLVLLLRDLEARMPFVGMRWLKNKVIGPRNVGAANPAEKQALLNRAVEAGLLETYQVDNRDEGGDPVTACRLVRGHAKVQAILAANPMESAAPPVVDEGERAALGTDGDQASA